MNILPPSVLVLLAILSIQVGSAGAKTLFASTSFFGVLFMRLGFAAVVLWLIARPQIRMYSGRQWRSVMLLGLALAIMNMAFYASIARLPLGITVTIEFLGPLAVAVFGSRQLRDFIWPLLALVGVLLLTPAGDLASLDILGIVFAFCAAAGWAAYIILAARMGTLFSGTSGLALAMTIGALITMPAGILNSGSAFLDTSLLFKGFLIAMLSATLPFSLEYQALKRMPPRVFGVFVSIEPAVAALVGFILLDEYLGIRECTAIVLVSFATIGVTLSRKKR